MRICFANNFFYRRGGAETVLLSEMAGLERRGHEVSIFARQHPLNLKTSWSRWFVPFREFHTLTGAGKLTAAFRIIHNRQAARHFKRMLQSAQPDIIHAHNIYGGLTTSILAIARQERIPVVMSLHDYKLVCPSYQMQRKGRPCEACLGGQFHFCLLHACHKENLSASAVYTAESCYNRWFGRYGWVDTLIAPSRFLLQVHRKGGLQERIVHLPNPANIPSSQTTLGSGRNLGYAVYLGRLSQEKGLMVLLEAAHGLDFPVVIAGDGPLKHPLEEILRITQPSPIRLAGRLEGRPLEGLLGNAAFLVLPSTWYENHPMCAIEAFSAGKAVVASRIGGIPELVQDGETGLLVEPGKPRELRAAMMKLWANPLLAAKLGLQGQRFVRDHLDLKTHCIALEQIYSEVIERNRNGNHRGENRDENRILCN
jgi:glycosyltransferase involved in cell wall biosynthesis